MQQPAETSRAETSLTQQAFWLLFARGIGIVVGLALPLVMVRIFDRSTIGIYRQVFLIITTAVNLLPLGFEMSAFYYLPREKDRAPLFVLNIVLFLTLVGASTCAVLVMWPEVLRYIIGSDALTRYGPLMGVTILTWMASSFLETVATAREEVKLSTVFIITSQVTKTVFLTIAALTFHTIGALLYASIIQGVLQFAILAWYLQRSFPGFWTRFDIRLFWDQAAYVIPFGISAIVFTAQSDLHTYLVANRFNAADYALYSVGTVQIPLVGLLAHAVNVVLLPKISRLQQSDMHEEIRLLMLASVRKLSVIYIPVTVVLLVLGREFLTTMYTSEYRGSWPIFAVNILSLPLYAMNTDAVVRAYAQYRYTMLILRLGMLAVLVNASIVAMNQFGMLGAIAAFTISGAIERVLLFTLCMRILDVKRSDWRHLRDVIKIVVAALFGAVGAFAIRYFMIAQPTPLVLILGLLVFCLLYAALILSMRVLDRDEKEMINEYTLKYLSIALFREQRL